MSTASLAAGAGALALFLGAVAALWRSMGLGPLLKGTRLFLLDWFGSPARPGVEAVPSFPERMANVEERAHATVERDAQLGTRLEQLTEAVHRLAGVVSDNRDAIARLDDRVSDHRRRNEQQVEQLRAEVDRRLRNISGDLLRAETFRAALVELGMDVDPPRQHKGAARQHDIDTEDEEDEEAI